MPVGEAHTADILELGRRGFVEIDSWHLVLLVVITFVHNASRTLLRFSSRPDRVSERRDVGGVTPISTPSFVGYRLGSSTCCSSPLPEKLFARQMSLRLFVQTDQLIASPSENLS